MDQRERKLYETMKEEMFLKVRGNSEFRIHNSEFIIDAKNASAAL
jgi:hypothetical protein